MPKITQSEILLFTDTELTRLFRTAEKMPHPYRNTAILHLLLDTGIRAAELAYDGNRPEESTGLRLEHIVLGRGDSYIWVMGKGRKARTIGLGQTSALSLRKYLNRERGRSLCPYVFLSRPDEPLSVRMLQQFLQT